jgi:hypothetical protein
VTGTVGSRSEEIIRFAWAPPQDPRLIYRIVGFIEYGKALELLDLFQREATPEELEIAEEIVRDQDQFIIFTNLSRHIEGATVLSERPGEEGDDFSRHGLAWVMALARVELGAMLAGFSSHAKPFQAIRPTEYETEEYRELLTDGMRTQYWSLKTDPVIQNYHQTGIPENHVITYGRRVSVARHFLQAVREFSRTKFLGFQLAELDAQEREMKLLQMAYLYCLSQKMAKSTTTTFTQALSGCPPLLAAARQELAGFEGPGATLTLEGSKFAEILRQIEPRLRTVPCQ